MENNPIKIHAVGLDERGINTLSFFFQKFCVGRCEMTAEDQAEVFMINMDSVNAAKQRAALEASSPLTPIILMSLHVVETEQHYFIRKPLIAKHLLDILTKIEDLPNRQLNVEKKNDDGEAKVTDVELSPRAREVERREQIPSQPSSSIMNAAQKLSQTDIVHFVGNRADVDLSDKANKESIYFDPKRYYLGHVQEAIALAKDNNCSIKLTGLSHTLFISPNLDSIYIELSDHKLRYYGITALYEKDIKSRYRTRFSYDFIKDDEVAELCDKQPNYKQNLQSFLWKISLWTARGRLPVGIPLDTIVYIQAWPNFTRLIEIPNALRIVASWIPQPRTLLNMTENLPIAQRNIFSFFTATYMLGLSGIAEREADILVLPTANNHEDDAKQKKNRGFFSRLMKKLTMD